MRQEKIFRGDGNALYLNQGGGGGSSYKNMYSF